MFPKSKRQRECPLGEEKKRYFLRKVKKRWCFHATIFGALAFSALVTPVLLQTDTVSAAAVDQSISTVTDADSGNHSLTITNSGFQSNFILSGDSVGSGKSQYFSNITTSSSGSAAIAATLTPPGSGYHNGAVAFNQQVDMTKNWTLSFDLDLIRLNGGGLLTGNGAGDFIGLILSPTTPNLLGTGANAGGLGIQGLANTLSWGIDFWNNGQGSPYYDPNISNPGPLYINGNQYVGFRQTDSSGNLIPYTTTQTASGTNMVAITSLSGSNAGDNGGVNDWGNSGTTPQLISNVQVQWNASSKTLTIINDSGTYVYNNYIPPTSSMSIGMGASDGGAWSRMGVTLQNFTLQLGVGTTVVHYVDQSGHSMQGLPNTQFIANTGESVGITGFSTGTPTYTYNYPTVPGYHLVSADTVTVQADTVSGSTTTPGNSMTLHYQADVQTANLTTQMNSTQSSYGITNPNPLTESENGVAGGAISFTNTDTTLHRDGYTYTVTGPNGTSYPTLAAALAANPIYDNTSNGTSTTDSAPQNFTVTYTAENTTISYAYLNANGSITPITTTPASLTNVSIGDTLSSYFTRNSGTVTNWANQAQTNKDATSTSLITSGSLASGYHLTGNVYWNTAGTPLPTGTLIPSMFTGSDGSYSGTILLQLAPDYQEANVNLQYTGTNPPATQTLKQSGVTGGSFNIDVLGQVQTGYHLQNSSQATFQGTFDNTSNLSVQTDSVIQQETVLSDPDSQTLNVQYQFPAGHDLSSQLTSGQKTQISTTNATFGAVSIPQIDGYTSQYTYNGVTTVAQTISGITADNTSNGTSTTDSSPQTVTVAYVANPRQITVNCASPGSGTQTITQGSSGNPYTTDSSYDTVQIPQVDGFTSWVSVNGGAATPMATFPAGVFGSIDITLNVTYQAWTPQVNYFTQQLDTTGNPTGALTPLPGIYASQTGTTSPSKTDFTQLNGTEIGTTANLQSIGAISQGYHVAPNGAYWSVTPDGTSITDRPPYTNNWNANTNEFTNIGTSTNPQFQAAIVYQFVADVQQANVTVQGAPSGSGISNGTTTYTGVTGGSQVVSVSAINGYLISVTDASGAPVSLVNNQFTITYDNTNNGENSTDSAPQTYTVNYIPRTANVVVNFTYAAGTTTTIAASPSTDTVAYNAPALPQSVQINTQTNGTYSLSVPSIAGYAWTITDNNGNTYTPSTLPASFTSDGTTMTYTVTYTAMDSTIIIRFYEAVYHADGTFTFTTTPVPMNIPSIGTVTSISTTKSVGNLLHFSVTSTGFPQIPGWSIDPMKAALGVVVDSLGNPDNDHLSGGDTAKSLVFLPGTQEYILYFARDIQSVHVNFVNDPQNQPTLYDDGFTGNPFSVDISSFARPGYTYVITDPSGAVVSSISGTYDSTSNGNAGAAIKNTGDGDSAPQIYTVTYTANVQTATLTTDATDPNGAGSTYETINGVSNGPLTFTTTDATLARSGYTYSVSVTSQGTTTTYGSFAEAIAAVQTFDTTDHALGTLDPSPQQFVVSYQPEIQQAVLVSDSSDPQGAKTIETTTGKTAQVISFVTTDSALARPGYTYTVTGPDGTAYSTFAAALAANSTYDTTENGNSPVDSHPQVFIVSYTANAQSVTIHYVYSNKAGAAASDVVQTESTNASGTPVVSPIIPGYTPNVSSVTLSFAVDASGNLLTPTITVTYSPNADTAVVSYQDTNGVDLLQYTNGAPTQTSGVTDEQILASAPMISGYQIKGFIYNGAAEDDNLADLSQAIYTSGADSIVFIYEAVSQTVRIQYVYGADSPKSMQTIDWAAEGVSPPTADQLSQTGPSNTTGTAITVPVIPGYTASFTTVTPDFTLSKSGDAWILAQPDIVVTYSPNSQVATIQYVDQTGTDISSLTGGAPITASGVTDGVITSNTPTIPGYTLTQILYTAADGSVTAEDITSNLSQGIYRPVVGSGVNSVQFIYQANAQQVNVHYVFQLPTGYVGTYNGTPVTAANNNGQEVPNLAVVTIDGVSNQASTSISAPTSPTDIPSGWQATPATSETIDWILDSNGDLKKVDYYFYISPAANDINILYVDTTGASLNQQISEDNLHPILTTQANTGAAIPNSGVVAIPGYTFVSYTYNGVTSNDPTGLGTVLAVAGQNNLTITYQANSQTVAIRYVDQNGKDLTGKTPSSGSFTTQQVSVSNGVGTLITVPILSGYAPSVSTVTPDFSINSNGYLKQPVITVVYTANPQTATIQYQDSTGQDISAKANAAVTTNASGVTDQVIPNNGAVNIPGYTLTQINYTPGGGTQTTITDLSQAVFSQGTNVLTFVYTANAQQVTVQYLYQGGGKDGQNVAAPLILSGQTDDASSPTTALTAPAGYVLASNSPQTVSWSVGPDGTLINPVITFLYAAQPQTAIVNYSVQGGVAGELNALVPTGTFTGEESGLSDSNLLVSGAVFIPGYTFSQMLQNGSEVATTIDAANAIILTFDPNKMPLTITYVYTADVGQVTYHFVDQNGKTIAPDQTDSQLGVSPVSTGDALPNNATTQIVIQGYALTQTVMTSATLPASGVASVTYVYQANAQEVRVLFVDNQGSPIQNIDGSSVYNLSGVSNAPIDYSSVNPTVAGYTLITDGRLTTTTYDTLDDPSGGNPTQVVSLVYSPNAQSLTVYYIVEGRSKNLANPLKLTGVSNGNVSYPTPPNFAGYQLYATTLPTTFDTVDAVDQTATYAYAPLVQQAILQTDGTDPNGENPNVETVAGPTDGPIQFTSTDATLYRMGYTYVVKGPDGMTYHTLSQALGGNPFFDETNGNQIYPSSVPDSAPQFFVATYTPMAQSAVVVTQNDPSGDKVYAAVSGLTKESIPTLNVTDNDLVRFGYIYNVVGPDNVTYSGVNPLEQALDENHLFDDDPDVEQFFTVYYIAQLQRVVISTNSSDPRGAHTVETETGPSDSNIALVTTDANLHRSGYTYAVIGPNGETYLTLADALVANPTYDNNAIPTGAPTTRALTRGITTREGTPTAGEAGVDPNPQVFDVQYTPLIQTAMLILDNDPTPSMNRSFTIQGNSDSPLNFPITDKDLARAGYTYVVVGPDGISYPSLAAALGANPNFDHDDYVDGEDPDIQQFRVIYSKILDSPDKDGGGIGAGTLGALGEATSLIQKFGFALMTLALAGLFQEKGRYQRRRRR